MNYCARYTSPIGPLLLVSDGDVLTGLYTAGQHPRLSAPAERGDLPLFHAVRGWLDGYFAGCPGEISFPLSPAGTAFQRRVWEILLTVPFGQTLTYGALARQLGPGMSAQAVGQALGKNPIAIIIPCHRIVGANGQLTGYAGGLERKKWLLTHEEETK